ncbi:Maltase 2, partial [Armadillidium vulgare]
IFFVKVSGVLGSETVNLLILIVINSVLNLNYETKMSQKMSRRKSQKRLLDDESTTKEVRPAKKSRLETAGSSKVSKKRKRPFWKNGIIYQIYSRSFYDSNDDGIGDIQGITAKADYFVELGVETIWLTPIFESPMKDFGYDISNYEEIDEVFGSMQDFENMIREMHSRDIKVILDFIPNHTSDQHEWFQKSLENDPKYKDYYLSVFRYSAWEWSEKRKQFYLHQFLKEQPDLNFRNPDVVSEMNNVFRFWLDKGVDGFRIDALKHLVEDIYDGDEPISVNSGETDATKYDYLDHIYTVNQPETFDITRGWRQILDMYKDKVMIVEVYEDDIDQLMKYYGTETDPLADFPFNFSLITNFGSRSDVTGTNLRANVEQWIKNMPKGMWPNWTLGNHDNKRVASRLGTDLVDALNIFILLLPGTPVTYYGEEIGMEDTHISFEDTQDPAGINSGSEHYSETRFSNASKTWIPVNENHSFLNVKLQNEARQSHLQVYKQAAQLRLENTFQYGKLKFHVANEDVVAFVRFYDDSPTYLIVINTSTVEVTIDIKKGSVELPDSAPVVIRSSTDNRKETEVGSSVKLTELSLIGGECLVFSIDE